MALVPLHGRYTALLMALVLLKAVTGPVNGPGSTRAITWPL